MEAYYQFLMMHKKIFGEKAGARRNNSWAKRPSGEETRFPWWHRHGPFKVWT